MSGRGRRMRDVAQEGLVIDVADLVIGPNVLEAGEQREVGDAGRRKALGAGHEARLPFREAQRELPEGAEAVRRAGLVVRLDDDALIGELGLEMNRLAAAASRGRWSAGPSWCRRGGWPRCPSARRCAGPAFPAS